VHVSYLASAHVAALDWLAKGRPSQSINVGNGRGFSVAEVVQTTEKVTGRSVKAEMGSHRAGAPPVSQRLQQGA
jgi:UDP-glucose 4-epimerase